MLQRDPLNHHHQFRPVDNRAGAVQNAYRQLERTALQPFVVQDKPAILPTQQLHAITGAVDEQKDFPRQWIAPHARFYQLAQTVKTLAHIGRLVIKIITQR